MFLPTTTDELKNFGWHNLDVILITGDTYIDSPFIGAAVIGRLLVKHGFKVGIIAQPDINSDKDITRLGEPSLFWGITSGAVDSMVSNYTALKKRRKSDDYTPGGVNNRRPDRALIVYTNLVKRCFKSKVPIVLGGIEASLRRTAHYDFWSDKVRRSILFDAKADYLLYGMAENSVVELADALKEKKSTDNIRGLCYISDKLPPDTLGNSSNSLLHNYTLPADSSSDSSLDNNKLKLRSDITNTENNILNDGKITNSYKQSYITLASYEDVKKDKNQFIQSFNIFYKNNDPLTAARLIQKQDSRYLIHNPPAFYPDTQEMDNIAALNFERDIHPYYKKLGKVKALDTIQFSISTHRGCYGECNFCSIAVHEGRTVRWRSEESILNEVKQFIKHPDFKGIISDIGGPTANMYGFECSKKLKSGACKDKRCLFPRICKSLKPDHSKMISLLGRIAEIKGVKKVFAASGIRYDLMFSDQKYGRKYLEAVVKNHVSGQLKIAPEHNEQHVVELMGKPDSDPLLLFKKEFDILCRENNKKQFLTYYLMAAHPGCTLSDMDKLKKFTIEKLKCNPEQIQIFTPTPSTYSTLMYYTEKSPFTLHNLFVEKNIKNKELQKKCIIK